MDLFVVDSNFLKTNAIDVFDSLVWTERYNASGDVTLTVPATTAMRNLIVEGIFLYMSLSREIMLIDTISIEDGVLKATGNSLVDFLKQRIARNTWSSAADSWGLPTGPAGQMANTVVTQMCISGGLISGSVLSPAWAALEYIPKLSVLTPPTGTNITAAVQYGAVYDMVKAICDLDDLGFSMYPPSVVDGSGNLVFMTYRGLDRTTSQLANPIVIFDPAMDSFSNIKELRSISGYKNVAYVWPNGITAQSQLGVAYAPGADSLSGWQRRTMMVDASDINVADYTAANLALVLNQKGRDALANNNYVRMLDGQLVPQNAFVYGTDYNLGDVIELRGTTSITQSARITEYIRAQDSTGETAYPTLSVIS